MIAMSAEGNARASAELRGKIVQFGVGRQLPVQQQMNDLFIRRVYG